MKDAKNRLTIGETARLLNVSIDTLRNWDASGKLRAMRSEGGHRYYDKETLASFQKELFALAHTWAESAVAPELSTEEYCETQDRFWSRQNVLALVLDQDSATHDLAPLLSSIVGEIGNNSFDHNIGNWPDTPGIFFAYDLNKRIIVLADRGRGVRVTLSQVRKNIESDIEALTIAMTERISGRAPEQRGNGLKFVRKVAMENPIDISLQSGIAIAKISGIDKKLSIIHAQRNARGTITLITY